METDLSIRMKVYQRLNQYCTWDVDIDAHRCLHLLLTLLLVLHQLPHFRTAPFSMTLNDRYPQFQGHAIL